MTEAPRPLTSRHWARTADVLFHRTKMAFGLAAVALIVWIGYGLFQQSALTRHLFGWSFLATSTWDVPRQTYGALPFLYGSVVATLVALALAVPIGVGAALFLAMTSPRWLSTPVAFLIELLAAVPSVIFGLWGFLVLCPWMQAHVNPWLVSRFGTIPLFAGPAYMTNLFAAGVVLAIMVLPVIASVSRQVILIVTQAHRDASLALGATRWEMIKTAVLPSAGSGISGAVILAFGRAIGETMAVVMVVGNNPQIQASLLKPGYTMPALLANQFNEAYTDAIQRSALLEVALILFTVTLLVNAMARLILLRTNNRMAGQATGPVAERAATALLWLGRLLGIGLLGFGSVSQVIADVTRGGVRGLFGPVEAIIIATAIVLLVGRLAPNSRQAFLWRKANDRPMHAVIALCAAIGCFFMGLLLVYIAVRGLGALHLDFFTSLPKPPDDPTGGMKNAIYGTLTLVGLASVIGIPMGLLGGIFLAEFGATRVGVVVRFSTDVLNGIPSVVIGLFAYTAFVLPFHQFSAAAGGAALGIMMVPTIVRTTEDILRLLPESYRDGSIALGATRVQTMFRVVLPAARAGVVTGIMLSISRIAGETAPLLFTAFGNDQIATRLSQPTSSITMMIYRYATSAYPAWIELAWSAALALICLIVVINLAARFATRSSRALL